MACLLELENSKCAFVGTWKFKMAYLSEIGKEMVLYFNLQIQKWSVSRNLAIENDVFAGT